MTLHSGSGETLTVRARFHQPSCPAAVYGKEHPNVARDANNIGMILKAQGDLDGAREQIGRALSIFERVYGPEHHLAVIARDNLAAI